ncbi:DUF3732 domain-containing protein [Photobacterium profundum]|uniref:Rad50/SbcC-type AAA domain-containing protein n=1 Tax=Photobacterium profundum (strain SS9) TaxID=298386 RepID=Q6LRT2_PHOPR|nr:DUF3732 domain-containing protein [Photobacterium profundum]CAG19994.1 hypothetical protein PBPRA1583 [Photobacterium profundum SS9]
MKAFLENVILIASNKEKRVLKFSQGLNIITGDSKTGKSALIEIVDYCLFSKRSTVPVGKVTDFTEIFCSVFKYNEKIIIIGRSKSKPTKCFFSVEYTSGFDAMASVDFDYFSAIKPRTRQEVQQDFEEHLGLSVDDTSLPEDDGNGRNKGKVSIRNATSLFFQHQNLVANKHSLFYRFDDFLKGKSVIDQFPIFMGWVDNKYYRLKKRADKLDKDIKKIEKEERKLKLTVQEQKNKLLIPIQQYFNVLNLRFTESDASLTRLKEIANKLPVVSVNAEQNVDFKTQLKVLDRKKNTELRLLYEYNQLIDLIEANDQESSDYAHSMNQLIELSKNERDVAASISCPVCSSVVERVGSRVEAAHHSRESLLQELSKVGVYKKDSSKSLNSQLLKRDQQKLKVAEVEKEIRQLNKLYNIKNDFAVRDVLNQIKGRVETILEFVVDVQKQEQKSTNLEGMKAELELNLAALRGYGLEHRFIEANALMNETMNELKNKLDFEEDLRDGEMKFKTEDFSFYYYCKKQEIRLSEMGSGANWLACHLAVFLSLLKLIAKSEAVIPAMLFLDQPSQVYFPKVTHRFSSNNKQELMGEERLDENIKQVINIFQVIKEFLDELERDPKVRFRPQVIVLEHADEPQFDDFIRYRWATEGEKLI